MIASAANPVAEKLNATSLGRLARGVGVDVSFLSRLFRGQKGARMETADRIARELGVTLDQLHQYVSSASSRAGV